MSKNNTVSFTSGGNKSSSFTSLGFLDTEGILKSSGLKRFTIRQNINGRSENDRFSYGLNLSANYSKSDEPNSIGSGAINRNYVLGAFSAAPYVNIDEYSDSHAKDGFCNVVRVVNVKGKIKNNKLYADSFSVK